MVPLRTQQDGADTLVVIPSTLTSTEMARSTLPVMIPWADIGPPIPEETELSTTDINQLSKSGAAIRAHGPHGLTSTVMA